MKANDGNYYRLQSSNLHLLNILEENYFIELGAVDLFLLSRLLKGVPLNLLDFYFSEITREGIGKIVDGSESELLLQLTYLLHLRQRSSSNKIFLTSGIIKYLNENQQELYAPFILIPVEIDISSGIIVKATDAMVNHLLIRKLKGEHNIVYNERITDVSQIDRMGLDFARRTNTVYKVDNFLTYGKVEYPDFVVPHDFFEIERSLFETDAGEIIRDFFKQTKAILPTNINQKYVILKTSRGLNVAVDGKLGTGKTHTIMNIIADKISKGKKILYVNQDIDNIYDLERHLFLLGLRGYIHNFIKMAERAEIPTLIKPVLSAETYHLDVIKPIERFSSNLDLKIHGFTYKFLLEELAILINNYPNIEEIPIEVDLKSFEVEKIALKLQDIEQTLKKIDPFKNNVWREIEPYYTADHIFDIIDVTKKFAFIQQELLDFISQFCERYRIHIPNNIREVHKLISSLRNFMLTPPPFGWSDSFQFDDAHQAIIAISVWQEKHYELVNYYQQRVNERYTVGLARTLLNRLYYRHLTKHDGIYIDRMLTKKAPLIGLINEISSHRYSIYQLEKNLKYSIKTKKLSAYHYTLFYKLETFIENNELLLPWVKEFMKEKFDDNFYQNINLKYIKFINIKEQLIPHALKAGQVRFSTIDNLIKHKKYPNNLNSLFKKHTLQTISLDDLKNNLMLYHNFATELNTALLCEERLIDNETQWQNFIDWFRFYHSLNPDELKLFQKILTIVDWRRPTDEQKIFKLITSFNREVEYFQSMFKHLKIYHIDITEDEVLKQIEEYVEWEAYLKDVVRVKKIINDVFIKEGEMTHRDLLEMSYMDEEFTVLGQTIDEKKEHYEGLLGEHYRGLNTDCTTISKLIDYFDEFSEQVIEQSDLTKLLEPKMIQEMTGNYFMMDRLYERWMNKYRRFNRYFHGGQPQFHELGLLLALEKINTFKNKIDQVTPMFKIIAHHKELRTYGLESLAKGIRESTYITGIKERYLYSTYLKMRKKLEQANYQLVTGDELIQSLNKFSHFEFETCTENIINLLKEADNLDKKGRIKQDVAFHEFNRILETSDRNKLLYLADINILNSNLDLSYFDTVIIDDGHLSSANKYHRIAECKQVIVFGDSSFRSSISNTLMKRISDASLVSFSYRYVNLGSHFKNIWHHKNQYLYDFTQNIEVIGFESLTELAGRLVGYFNKNTNHIINVVIASEHTKRNLFSEILLKLKNHYSDQEIIQILSYNIRIINAITEGTRYVNDTFIFYPDLENYDSSLVDLILKNYSLANVRVALIYLIAKNIDVNEEVKQKLNLLIGKNESYHKSISGISEIVYKKLRDLEFNAEPGFGKFEIVIKDTFNVGIMILERNTNDIYSLIDDYQFYYEQYTKNGWLVKILFTSDLINQLDQTLEKLTKEINAFSKKFEKTIKNTFPERKLSS